MGDEYDCQFVAESSATTHNFIVPSERLLKSGSEICVPTGVEALYPDEDVQSPVDATSLCL